MKDKIFYSVYHKPTKTWVYFKNCKLEPQICLCLKMDATQLESKKDLVELLKNSSFNQQKNYGVENFLEFQIKKNS